MVRIFAERKLYTAHRMKIMRSLILEWLTINTATDIIGGNKIKKSLPRRLVDFFFHIAVFYGQWVRKQNFQICLAWHFLKMTLLEVT